MQSIATPGFIFISEVVHHNVSNKNDIYSEFVKIENLNNVKDPVKVYRIKLNGESTPTVSRLFTSVKEKAWFSSFVVLLPWLWAPILFSKDH